MIKMSDLIFEKFELPTDLQKQLENTGYSALGHVLPSYIEKFQKNIFANKKLNDKSYDGIKNVLQTVRQFTEGSGGNTKLTFTDVLLPEYYSVTQAKKQIRKASITIEKTEDAIYVESDEKKDKLFPGFVINKDYAGWDLERINRYWKEIDGSYQDFNREFDEKLVLIENILGKVKSWQTLDKPRKPKTSPDGQKATWVFEKKMPSGELYEHYFRVMPSRKVDTYDSPDHFSNTEPPRIIQTIYLEEFDPNVYRLDVWMIHVHRFIGTSRHEGRHLLQHYGNVQKKLRGDYYGGPKKGLRHQYNKDVRGQDPSGIAGPTALHKEPNDKWNRVLHPFRDVEFKTNLYNYKEDLENFLRNNLPTNRWKEGFRDAIQYSAGVIDYGTFKKKHPFSSTFSYTVVYNHLKQLFKHDRPKFDQAVKELYKLIFNK